MEDRGVNFEDYEKQCKDTTLKFPEYVTKFFDGNAKAFTESKKKELLEGMTVYDDENKQQFRQLMSYFRIEGVLLCGSNSKMPRRSTWWMVKDLEACESVNWAKPTEEHLHKSMAYAKAWLVNTKLEEGAQAQHGFMGCTRALKAIVYERIPKIRSCTHSRQSPSIQIYITKKRCRQMDKGKLSQLAESDVCIFI